MRRASTLAVPLPNSTGLSTSPVAARGRTPSFDRTADPMSSVPFHAADAFTDHGVRRSHSELGRVKSSLPAKGNPAIHLSGPPDPVRHSMRHTGYRCAQLLFLNHQTRNGTVPYSNTSLAASSHPPDDPLRMLPAKFEWCGRRCRPTCRAGRGSPPPRRSRLRGQAGTQAGGVAQPDRHGPPTTAADTQSVQR